MDSQFSPFGITPSPAMPGSLLMPPPSLPPPSLPPPSTNERPSDTPPHSSNDKERTSDARAGSVAPQSSQNSLIFPNSINLASYNPFSAQAPSTPLASVPSAADSHLLPTLQ